MDDNNKTYISVGIPTFNSSKYLTSCIKSVIKKKSVNEIIISDDCSNEFEIEKIKNIIKKFKNQKNIKLLKNNTNLGAYENKLNLIKNSKNEYIYVLDSDNLAGKNFDKIITELLNSGDLSEEYLIQPNTMYQFWKYPNFAKLFSKFDKKYIVKFYKNNKTIDSSYVKKSLLLNSGDYILDDLGYKTDNFDLEKDEINPLLNKWVFWILNCGNFIVNKNIMSEIAQNGLILDRSIRSVDAVAFSYLWLSAGKKIRIHKKFFHHHRKRNDSVSYTEIDSSKKGIIYFIKEVLDKF